MSNAIVASAAKSTPVIPVTEGVFQVLPGFGRVRVLADSAALRTGKALFNESGEANPPSTSTAPNLGTLGVGVRT